MPSFSCSTWRSKANQDFALLPGAETVAAEADGDRGRMLEGSLQLLRPWPSRAQVAAIEEDGETVRLKGLLDNQRDIRVERVVA